MSESALSAAPDFIDGNSPTLAVIQSLSRAYGVPFKLAATRNQLPPEAKLWADKHAYREGLQALYDRTRGEIWLITSELGGPYDAAKSFLHEVVGHHGVGHILGDRRDAVMLDIYASYADSPVLEALNARYRLDLTKKTNQITLAEELVAHMAETGRSPTKRQAVEKATRESISKASDGQVIYQDSDIQALLVRARDSLRELANHDREELPYTPTAQNTVLAKLMAQHHDTDIMEDMQKWMQARGRDPGEALQDPNILLAHFRDFLEDSAGISVSGSGVVRPAKIDDRVRRMIGAVGIAVTLPAGELTAQLKQGLRSDYSGPLALGMADGADASVAIIQIDQLREVSPGRYELSNARPDQFIDQAVDHRFAAMYVGEAGALPEAVRSDFEFAVDMEAHGCTPAAIKRDTGWRRGLDGDWRFEISDRGIIPRVGYDRHLEGLKTQADRLGSKIAAAGGPTESMWASLRELQEATNSFTSARGEPGTLGRHLYHRELFALYPDLPSLSVLIDPEPGAEPRYDETKDVLIIDSLTAAALQNGGEGLESALSAMVHEIQHVVQAREGWARGATPDNDLVFAEKVLAQLKNDHQWKVAHAQYLNALDSLYEGPEAAEMPPAEVDERRYAIERSWRESSAGKAYYAARANVDAARDGLERYMSSAGEIEARATQFRRLFTDTQREQIDDFISERRYVDKAIVNYDERLAALYIGRGAQGIDLAPLSEAMAQEEAGAEPQDIWRNTGWFRGFDGKWRCELDDSQATIRAGVLSNAQALVGDQPFVATDAEIQRKGPDRFDVTLSHSETGEFVQFRDQDYLTTQEMLPPSLRAQLTGIDSPGVMAQTAARRENAAEDAALQVYHGTPYHFDAFSLEAVGTGEGVQAYGYGLYFASSEHVANFYQSALSTRTRAHNTLDGRRLSKAVVRALQDDPDQAVQSFFRSRMGAVATGQKNLVTSMDEYLDDHRQQRQEIQRRLDKHLANPPIASTYTPEDYAARIDSMDKFIAGLEALRARIEHVPERVNGRVVSAAIPPDEAYLRYEAAWDEQSVDLREKLERGSVRLDTRGGKATGQELYAALSSALGSDREASHYLGNLGIPGLRYEDYRQRKSGEGGFNYVVWDDAVISIVTPEAQAAQAELAKGGENANTQFDMDHAARQARAAEQGFDTETVFYRGQHGGADGIQSRNLPVFTSDPETAAVYAISPNDRRDTPLAPVVFPVYVKRGKSVALTGDQDPFVEFTTLKDLIGEETARAVFIEHSGYVENTNGGQEALDAYDVLTTEDLPAEAFDELYLDFHAIADDPIVQSRLRQLGYTAIEGWGISAATEALEYRPLIEDQVRSVHDGFVPGETDPLMVLSNLGAAGSVLRLSAIGSGVPIPGVAADANGTLRLSGEIVAHPQRTYPLGDLLDYPALYEAYPALAQMSVRLVRDSGSEQTGSYDPSTQSITLSLGDADAMRVALLHEIQHAIQTHEGFAIGGTPDSVAEQVRDDAFARWFRDSVVVDKEQQPLRVYHFTQRDFDAFSHESASGFYFADDPRYFRYANQAPNAQDGNRVIPAYLKLHNPAYVSASQIERLGRDPEAIAELKAQGYDGAIYTNSTGWGDDFNQYIAFYPYQIKSAIGNEGSFDLTSDRLVAREQTSDFYSELESQITRAVPQAGWQAGHWLQAVQDWVSEGIVTQDELAWSGLLYYLDGLDGYEVVSADAALRMVRENRAELVEIVKTPRGEALASAMTFDRFEPFEDGCAAHEVESDIVLHDMAISGIDVSDPTAAFAITFDDEVIGLGQVPGEAMAQAQDALRNWPERLGQDDVTERPDLPGYREMLVIADMDTHTPFTSLEHYEDNVLGFVAMSDAQGSAGERVLRIHRADSDWHTQIQEGGARPSEMPEAYFHLSSEGSVQAMALNEWGEYEPVTGADYDSIEQAHDAVERLNKRLRIDQPEWKAYSHSPNTLPVQAPHSEGWPEMLMRRVIRRAVQEGYDRIELPSPEDPLSAASEADERIYRERLPRTMGRYVAQWGADIEMRNGRQGFDITSAMRESVQSRGQPMYRIVSPDAQWAGPRYIERAAEDMQLGTRAVDNLLRNWPAHGGVSYCRDMLAQTPLLVAELAPENRLGQLRGKLELLRRYEDESVLTQSDVNEFYDPLSPADRWVLQALPPAGTASEYLNALDQIVEHGVRQQSYLWAPMEQWLSEKSPQAVLTAGEVGEAFRANQMLISETLHTLPGLEPVERATLEQRDIMLNAEGFRQYPFYCPQTQSSFAVVELDQGFYLPDLDMTADDLADAELLLTDHVTGLINGPYQQDRYGLFISAEGEGAEQPIQVEANLRRQEGGDGEVVLLVDGFTRYTDVDPVLWEPLMIKRLSALALELGADRLAWNAEVSSEPRALTDLLVTRSDTHPDTGERRYLLRHITLDGALPLADQPLTLPEIKARLSGPDVHNQLDEAFVIGNRKDLVFHDIPLRVEAEPHHLQSTLAQDFFARHGADVSVRDGQLSVSLTGALRNSLHALALPIAARQGTLTGRAVESLYAVLPDIAQQLPRRATGEHYAERLETLQRKGHFKRLELDDCGVLEWLRSEGDTSLTREAVHGYIQAHQVRLREHLYMRDRPDWWETDATPDAQWMGAHPQEDGSVRHEFRATHEDGELAYEVLEINGRFYLDAAEGVETAFSLKAMTELVRREAEEDLHRQRNDVEGPPRYSASTLGGAAKRYGEIVVSVDNRDQQFESPHWPSIPNVVGHIRFAERRGEQGERVLGIEEIQADWAQAVRHDRTDAMRQPPFGGQYPLLLMKRALDYAVRNGFDQVTWPNVDDISQLNPPRAHFALTFTPAGQVDGEPLYRVRNQVNYPVAIAPMTKAEIRRDFAAPGLEAFLSGQLSQTGDSTFHGMITQHAHAQGVARLYSEVIPSQLNRYLAQFGAKNESLGVLDSDLGVTNRPGFRINDALRRAVMAGEQPMYALEPQPVPDFAPAAALSPALKGHSLEPGVVREALHQLHPETGRPVRAVTDERVRALISAISQDDRPFVEVERELLRLSGLNRPGNAAFEAYRNLSGEQEARDVEWRANLSAAQRRDIMPMTAPGLDRDRALTVFSATGPMAMFGGEGAVTAPRDRLAQAKARLNELTMSNEELATWDDLRNLPRDRMSPVQRQLSDHLLERWNDHDCRHRTVWKEFGCTELLGDWVWEINDENAHLKASVEALRGKDYLEMGANRHGTPEELVMFTASANYIEAKKYPLAQVLHHPALFEAYPQLAYLMVADVDTASTMRAEINLDTGVLTYNRHLPDADIVSAILREVQSMVGAIEDMTIARKGTPLPEADPAAVERYRVVDEAVTLLERAMLEGVSWSEQRAAARRMATDPRVKSLLGSSSLTRGDLHRLRLSARPAALTQFARYADVPGEALARDTASRQRLPDAQRRAQPPEMVVNADLGLVQDALDQRMAYPPRMMNRLDEVVQHCAREGSRQAAEHIMAVRERQYARSAPGNAPTERAAMAINR